MNRIKSALIGLLVMAGISPAIGQSAPATMPYHTVYGRMGAAPGDSGPGQAIPFSVFNLQAFNSLCQTNNAMPVYSTAQGKWICTPTRSANTVLAGPSTGAAAQAAYRALVGADLPLPAASTLGGVMSKAAVASNWLRSIGTDGIPTASQPNFTDLAGTIAAAQIPANVVTSGMLRQGVARSVIGVTGNATANVADIQGTANQALVVNSAGTALAFGQVNLASSSAVTGTLPLANGGTGDTGTAWGAFTASPSCGTATITTNNARSKTVGKTMFLEVDLTITAIGTCTQTMTFTLPATAQSGGSVVGREYGVSGKGFACDIRGSSATATCSLADFTSMVVNAHMSASGVFETQ